MIIIRENSLTRSHDLFEVVMIIYLLKFSSIPTADLFDSIPLIVEEFDYIILGRN